MGVEHTFEFDQEVQDGKDRWISVNCGLSSVAESEPLLKRMAAAVRLAYGEDALRAMLTPDPALAELVDVNALMRGLTLGLPDPEAEGEKPRQLRNSRSEAAEVLVREVHGDCSRARFPANPQSVKLNANQPILGFDGWGLLDGAGAPRLLLLLVKGTEEPARPPAVSQDLIDECTDFESDLSALSRALVVMAQLVNGTSDAAAILTMLESLGNGKRVDAVFAPTIVRGMSSSELGDLESIRAFALGRAASYLGATISVGVPLGDFGDAVFGQARAA